MSYLTRTDNDKSMTSWDDFFNGFFDNMGTYNRKTPFVDVKENDAEFELQADLPGFTEKDVNLKLENHVLVISSKHEEEKNEDKKDRYLLKERYSTSFERKFSLPENVNETAIDASFKNGVLTVKIPKLKTEKPKEIAIKIN